MYPFVDISIKNAIANKFFTFFSLLEIFVTNFPSQTLRTKATSKAVEIPFVRNIKLFNLLCRYHAHLE